MFVAGHRWCQSTCMTATTPQLRGLDTRMTVQTRNRPSFAFDIWAFVLPAVSFIELPVIGRLQLSEVIAIAIIPWVLGRRDGLHVPRWFIVLWGGWLLCQVLTDLAAGSAFADYSRGWAKIVVTLTSLVAILGLVSSPRRARLFVVGLAFATIAEYVVRPTLATAIDPWKWAFAMPIGLLLAAALSGKAGLTKPALPVLAFGVFGVLNVALGYRSLGGVALVTSAYLAINAIARRDGRHLRPSISGAVMGAMCSIAIVVAVLYAYDWSASSGLLGPDARARYDTQSGSFGVFLGGRPELLVSTQAVLDSPVLGHGSWARDPKYIQMLSDRLVSLGYQDISTDPADVVVIPAHSYLVCAWVEGGILGGVFWLGVAVFAGWLLLNLYAVRWILMPLLVFSTSQLLWDIGFSPYGEAGRLSAPFAIALCVLAYQRTLPAAHAVRDAT
jgi:hypothetical protein